VLTFKTAVTAFFLSRALNAALPFAVLAAALWRGGWRERVLAAFGAVEWVAYKVWAVPWTPAGRLPRGVRDLVVDAVFLVVCLVCLRHARRYWVVWVAALALLAWALDGLFLMSPRMSQFTFGHAQVLLSYVLDAVLIWASLTAPRAEPA
jgi:hypothetical protein